MGETAVCWAAIFLIGSRHNTLQQAAWTIVPAATRFLQNRWMHVQTWPFGLTPQRLMAHGGCRAARLAA